MAGETGLVVGIFAAIGLWIGGGVALTYLVLHRNQLLCTLIRNGIITLKVPDLEVVRASLEPESGRA